MVHLWRARGAPVVHLLCTTRRASVVHLQAQKLAAIDRIWQTLTSCGPELNLWPTSAAEVGGGMFEHGSLTSQFLSVSAEKRLAGMPRALLRDTSRALLDHVWACISRTYELACSCWASALAPQFAIRAKSEEPEGGITIDVRSPASLQLRFPEWLSTYAVGRFSQPSTHLAFG